MPGLFFVSAPTTGSTTWVVAAALVERVYSDVKNVVQSTTRRLALQMKEVDMRQLMVHLTVSLLVISTLAAAQVEPPVSTSLELEVACDISAPTDIAIQLAISDSFTGTLYGFGIERTVMGDCDAEPILLEPIVTGELAAGRHTLTWTDTTADYGVMYRYRVYGVDLNGDPRSGWSSGFDNYSLTDYTSCGAVIGVGTVTTEFAPGVFVPCEGSCYPRLTVSATSPLFAPYADTGVVVELRGSVECSMVNFEGCLVSPSAVVPADCAPVDNDDVTWGAIKSRF